MFDEIFLSLVCVPNSAGKGSHNLTQSMSTVLRNFPLEHMSMSGTQLMVLKQPYATAHTYQVNS